VLVLGGTRPGRFAPAEQALAQALARRAAQALALAQDHAEARSLNAELEAVVNRRTEELQATILKLEAEIAQRERAQGELEVSRQQLRNLSARLEAAREAERARIAHEVHDELGQQLASLKMDALWLRKKLREQQEPLLKKAREMAEVLDATVQTVRKITTELRPGILDDFGLLAAIEWQLQDFQTRTGIEGQLLTEVDEIRLDPEDATAIFRVFQETLANVARHAKATRVDVSLRQRDGMLRLVVEDNGRGITVREATGASALGILGMRERLQRINGTLEIRGAAGEGTVVEVCVPLARAGAGDNAATQAAPPADAARKSAPPAPQPAGVPARSASSGTP
jgi:signal transduction histidine kinase